MIRTLSLLLILVLLPGCFATKKRCLRLYTPVSDTVVIEIVRDSIAYRDTTLIVELPGQTIIDSIFVPVGPGTVHSDTLRLETDLAWAEAYYRTPQVHLRLVQKDTTLYFQIDSLRKEVYWWKEKYTEVTNQHIIPEKYIPKIYKYALWAWVGVIGFTVIRLLLRKWKS